MIYLCGPMTIAGPPDYNYPLFTEVTAQLRAQGHKILTPTECNPVVGERPWDECMRRDLVEMLSHCTGIAFLNGWQDSRGATWEMLNAKVLHMKQYQVIHGEFNIELRERPYDLGYILDCFRVAYAKELG